MGRERRGVSVQDGAWWGVRVGRGGGRGGNTAGCLVLRAEQGRLLDG